MHCRKATTKPQSVKGAFLRMLTNKIKTDIYQELNQYQIFSIVLNL